MRAMTTVSSKLDRSSVMTRTDAVLIVIHSFMISSGLMVIAGMLSAAAAFTGGWTITIPLVATFHGFSEAGGSPAMTMTGSWVAIAALIAALTVVFSLVIVRISRPRGVRRSGS